MYDDHSNEKSQNKTGQNLASFSSVSTPYLHLTVAILLLAIICIILLCVVPPISRDALTHHLYVPKLYLLHGSIYELPEIEFSYFPMNVDLLYMLSLHFGNDIFPKFIHFSFALATSSLIFIYLQKRLSIIWGFLGALFFLTTPIVIKLSVTAYVDLGLIFFSTASLLLILRWADNTTNLRYILLSAVFCGLALGTKYNGLITLLLLSLFIPVLFQRDQTTHNKSGLKAFGYCILFILICGLVYSPWGVKNFLWTGNPIYPLFGSLFGTGGSEVMSGIGPFVTRKILYNESLLKILLIPVRIFFEGQDNNPQFFDGKLNPFLFILPFFAFFSRYQNSKLQQEKIVFASFTLLYFLIVFFQRDIRIRYIGPCIPPVVILSILGLNSLLAISAKQSLFQYISRYFVFLAIPTLLFINFHYLYYQFKIIQPFPYLSGKATRSEYISRFRPEYPVIEYANRQLAKNSNILCVFLGNRGYYFDIKHQFDLRHKTSLLCTITKNSKTPTHILQELQNLKITHIIIRHDIWKNWTRQNLTLAEISRYSQFQATYTKILHYNGDYVLLEIQPLKYDSTTPPPTKE